MLISCCGCLTFQEVFSLQLQSVSMHAQIRSTAMRCFLFGADGSAHRSAHIIRQTMLLLCCANVPFGRRSENFWMLQLAVQVDPLACALAFAIAMAQRREPSVNGMLPSVSSISLLYGTEMDTLFSYLDLQLTL